MNKKIIDIFELLIVAILVALFFIESIFEGWTGGPFYNLVWENHFYLNIFNTSVLLIGLALMSKNNIIPEEKKSLISLIGRIMVDGVLIYIIWNFILSFYGI